VSISRTNYLRIVCLGCFDILLTFPLGVASAVINAKFNEPYSETHSGMPFYLGWDAVHANWQPVAISYSTVAESGFWPLFSLYFMQWTPAMLGLIFLTIFGLTSETRAAGWRAMSSVGKLIGWVRPVRKRQLMSEVKYGLGHIPSTSWWGFFNISECRYWHSYCVL
jgi:hypothetical protein